MRLVWHDVSWRAKSLTGPASACDSPNKGFPFPRKKTKRLSSLGISGIDSEILVDDMILVGMMGF